MEKPSYKTTLWKKAHSTTVNLPFVISGIFFCRPDEFICNNTLCKLHAWVCDGKDDCGDNSDEDTEMCGGLK